MSVTVPYWLFYSCIGVFVLGVLLALWALGRPQRHEAWIDVSGPPPAALPESRVGRHQEDR